MLKYLFKAEFTDGTAIEQTKEDVSKTDPKRSAFYDVLQSKKTVKKFTLKRLLDRYSVDLQTGEFDINGTKITVENEKPLPFIDNAAQNLKLIYFRQHRQPMSVSYSLGSGKILGMQPSSEQVTYVIGWETNIKGKTYKRIIGVK